MLEFSFRFALSYFLGRLDQVEILGKVGKELDGMSIEKFSSSFVSDYNGKGRVVFIDKLKI